MRNDMQWTGLEVGFSIIIGGGRAREDTAFFILFLFFQPGDIKGRYYVGNLMAVGSH